MLSVEFERFLFLFGEERWIMGKGRIMAWDGDIAGWVNDRDAFN